MKKLAYYLLVFCSSTLTNSVFCQNPADMPSDSILCERFGQFIPNENRIFHSLMFDSLEAVRLNNQENPTITDLQRTIWLPEVSLTIQSSLDKYNQVIQDTNLQKFRSLDYKDIVSLYRSTLIFEGEVIAANNISTEPKYFMSTYLIRVGKIYFSYWPEINSGDTIVMKTISGAYKASPKDMAVGDLSIRLKKGEQKIFTLNNADYHVRTHLYPFVEFYRSKKYTDTPCSGFFTPSINHLIDDFEKKDDIKEYLARFINQ